MDNLETLRAEYAEQITAASKDFCRKVNVFLGSNKKVLDLKIDPVIQFHVHCSSSSDNTVDGLILTTSKVLMTTA
jgi:hypothetical protein